MMEAASQSDLEQVVDDDPTPPLGTSVVPSDRTRPRGSTTRIRKRLDEVMGRLHSKLDEINGDSAAIAKSIPHKATQMACEAFKLDEEEETDDAQT